MGSILGKGVNWAEGTYAHFQIIASRYINSRASLSSLTGDERKRKTRYYVFIALGVLLLIWTVRLSLPQHATVDVIPVGNKYLPISSGPSDKFVPAVPTEGVTVPGELNFSKTAVIIETRFRTNLIPLILHFGSVLGPSWPIVIYTSPESVGLFSASAALNRYLKTGTVELRLLPQSTLFTNSDSVNEFMTDKWLWEDLAPAEHILIFQSDSMLCANAARSVDDYFEYDLVGAPIAPHLGNGYNGGLSLRKRSSILKVLNKWNWIDTKDQGDKERYEDQWFSGRLQALEASHENPPVKLPSMEIARTFAVETIDYPHPLGVHQVHRWIKETMVSMDEWCPEYKLCSEGYIKDTPTGG